MFVFGAQYLRGATPVRGDWDRDFARMAENGFNTVRAWLVWNTVEKTEGTVDFESLNALLDAAGKHGISVGFLFHLHAAPEWLVRRYPQYRYVNAEGLPFEPSVRPNTPSGGWPGFCYDNPEVPEIEERFITEVVRGLSGRKEISFWEPMNEPHQWVDLARSPVGWFCYC
jgi:beta-galactosidase GanA